MAKNKYQIRQRYLRHFIISAMLDVVIIVVAYAAAFSVRAVITPMETVVGLQLILFETITLIIVFYLFGIYKNLWAQTSGHRITIIINAVAICTALVTVINLLIRPQPLPFSIIYIGNLLALGGFITVRYRSRVVSGLTWRWQAIWNEKFPKPQTRILIIGAGQSGQELAVQLKHRQSQVKYQVVGFIDDDPEKHGMLVEGCKILGSRHEIAQVVEQHLVDLVIVAIHNISGPDFREILTQCENTKAMIKVIPDTFALMNGKENSPLLRDVQPEDLLGRSMITHHEDVDLAPVTDKVILVTGAAGSIGSELSRQLPNYRPTKLILLDSNESGLYDLSIELKALHPNAKLVYKLANITQIESLEKIFNDYRPQVIFHAAAYKHVPMLEEHPDEAVQVNIGGTHNLASLAQKYDAERFVLISTDKAVNPTSVMGASKRICELSLRALSKRPTNKTLFTSVRFGNVLGSRGSVVPTFNYQIDRGGPITITDAKMSRYFMTIPEACNLVIHAACLTNGTEVFLLKMGEEVKIIDLAERMIRMRGLRPYQDIQIQVTGVRAGEKLHEQLYDGSAENATETVHPGIIQLNISDDKFNDLELLEWIKNIRQSGISNTPNPLRALMWNMSSSEKYAILGTDENPVVKPDNGEKGDESKSDKTDKPDDEKPTSVKAGWKLSSTGENALTSSPGSD
jgi:FlaA1/EpsC-like NDP-sugar epimerase